MVQKDSYIYLTIVRLGVLVVFLLTNHKNTRWPSALIKIAFEVRRIAPSITWPPSSPDVIAASFYSVHSSVRQTPRSNDHVSVPRPTRQRLNESKRYGGRLMRRLCPRRAPATLTARRRAGRISPARCQHWAQSCDHVLPLSWEVYCQIPFKRWIATLKVLPIFGDYRYIYIYLYGRTAV